MLTLLVEIIIGVFISNFKSEDHPYKVIFFKGIALGLASFVLYNLISLFRNQLMSFDKQVIFFIASQVIGFIYFLFCAACEFLRE